MQRKIRKKERDKRKRERERERERGWMTYGLFTFVMGLLWQCRVMFLSPLGLRAKSTRAHVHEAATTTIRTPEVRGRHALLMAARRFVTDDGKGARGGGQVPRDDELDLALVPRHRNYIRDLLEALPLERPVVPLEHLVAYTCA
jgi:hypothetical protein